MLWSKLLNTEVDIATLGMVSSVCWKMVVMVTMMLVGMVIS